MNNPTLKDSIDIIWGNIFKVEDYLALYEVIDENSPKLKDNNAHFWGTVRQSALDSAVLNICKLFDNTNKKYEKHTIPSLIENLGNQTNKVYISYDIQLARNLGICNKIIQIFDTVRENSTYFDKNSERYEEFEIHLLNSFKEVCPNSKEPPLEKLFQYRNKVLAHQEKLDQARKEQLKRLPSLDEMHQLVTWGKNFCEFTNKLFFPHDPLPEFLAYSGAATKGVIDKYLGE